MRIVILLLSIWWITDGSAQTVETLASHPKIWDGLHVDAAGFVYTTPGGLVNGTAVGRYEPGGDFDPNFAPGFNGPIDIDEDSQGRLYVTNYDNNTLKVYDPATQEVTTLAVSLDGPAGIVLDAADNVYITCFGSFPLLSGNQVVRVFPSGNKEVWLETNEFYRPQGIAFDDAGNLWVANSPSGRIFKVDTLTKTPVLIADLQTKVGNMTFRQKDQHLYFTSQNPDVIYRMDLQGNYEKLAGNGLAQTVDGDFETAGFNRPLGIAFSSSEDSLYVAEVGTNSLRLITGIDNAVSTVVVAKETAFHVSPNPSEGRLTVTFPADRLSESTQLSLLRMDGKKVWSKTIAAAQKSVELEGLEKGCWLLQWEAGGVAKVQKVVIN